MTPMINSLMVRAADGVQSLAAHFTAKLGARILVGGLSA